MQRFDEQLAMAGGFQAGAASSVTANFALEGLLRLVAQSEEIGGAAAVTVAKSLIVFTDADTPASSNITLSTTGHLLGQVVYILSASATNTDVVLLAASLVGANNITLSNADEFTILMWNGTAWLNIGGTAPA